MENCNKAKKGPGRPSGGTNTPTIQNDLDPTRLQFIAAFIRLGEVNKACREAGIATGTGSKYLKEPAIQKLLAESRDRIMAEAEYTTAKAMQEADDAIAFARSTENANAYVKAVELRAKLSGLLIEKIDVRQATGFQIRIGIPGLSSPTEVVALPVPVEALQLPAIDVPKLVTQADDSDLLPGSDSDPFEDDPFA